jgi:hypothetical protein
MVTVSANVMLILPSAPAQGQLVTNQPEIDSQITQWREFTLYDTW